MVFTEEAVRCCWHLRDLIDDDSRTGRQIDRKNAVCNNTHYNNDNDSGNNDNKDNDNDNNPLRFEYNQTPLQAETQRKFTSARNATDLVHSSNPTCGCVPSRGNKSNNSAWTGYTEITLLWRILLPFIRWFGCWVVTVIQNKGVVGGSSQRWVSVYFFPEKGGGYFHLVWRGLIKKDEQIDVRVWISFDYFEGIFKLETS